ncbi:MAG TPA: hypothetical protein VM238_14990 [Phycisphaerae bacterium]|nr:hypothetical protein [Phycisphaerae bacterium]
MPLSFKSAGVYATGGAPEASPNATPPAAARIYEVPDVAEHGNRAYGVRFYFELTGGSGTPTLDVTTWVFDETSGAWVLALAITGIAEYVAAQVANVAPGRVFFQVAAESGTFTSAEFFAAGL